MNHTEEDLLKLTNKILVGAQYDAMKQAYDCVQEDVIGVVDCQLDKSSLEVAVQGTFYRAHAVAASLTRLNHIVDFSVAAICCRTIYELWLDLRVLTNPERFPDAVEKYHAFPEVQRYRAATRILDLENKFPELRGFGIFASEQRQEFIDRSGKKDEVEDKVKKLWGVKKCGKLNCGLITG